MILISPTMARHFLAAARKCRKQRTRVDGDVVIRCQKGKLTFTAAFDEVVFQLAFPGPQQVDGALVSSMGLLERLQDVKAAQIELHLPANRKGEARWTEGSTLRSCDAAVRQPEQKDEAPLLPDKFSVMPECFLKNLHECGRSAAQHDSRFTLTCIQLRGKVGQMIGTDAHQAIICHGFKFPFDEDVLVPAIPLFGLKPLHDPNVQVGRTKTHVVLKTERWTAWLSIVEGKYPDVAGLIPSQSPTLIRIDPLDVDKLSSDLMHLPGANEKEQPATLDAASGLAIRGQDEETKETREIVLERARVEGEPACFAVDRRLLARALSLGCLTLRFKPPRLLVAAGESMTMLIGALEGATAPAKSQAPTQSPPVPERSNAAMKPPDATDNGRGPNGRPEPPPAESADPLVLIEELRATLIEASTKAAKLAAVIKGNRREKKVLANVFAGLKQLNLD